MMALAYIYGVQIYIHFLLLTFLLFILSKFIFGVESVGKKINGPLFIQQSLLYMQDNDPKHTSHCARSFFDANGVNWWIPP